MPKSRFLLSSASGVLVGALVFGASPAFAQIAVFDWANNAVQVAIKGDRADDVQHAELDHQPTHCDRTARDLAGKRPVSEA